MLHGVCWGFRGFSVYRALVTYSLVSGFGAPTSDSLGSSNPAPETLVSRVPVSNYRILTIVRPTSDGILWTL